MDLCPYCGKKSYENGCCIQEVRRQRDESRARVAELEAEGRFSGTWADYHDHMTRKVSTLEGRVAELEQANTILDSACTKALNERDRYRAGLAEMAEELGHYPEGPGIFGHLKGILRRTLSPQDGNPSVPEFPERS